MEYKVSVIIPVYNGSEYIRRAVNSAHILEEVGEVIIIDDGSTDDSVSRVESLVKEFEKVRFFKHDDHKNHGPAASRNLGIGKARFDFISFLDADDYYLPSRFKIEKELFRTQNEVDGVYGCIQNVFEDENSKELFFKVESDTMHGITEYLPPASLFNALISFSFGRICLPAITIKKSTLLKVGLFNEALRWSEDTELWLKLASKYKLAAGDLKNPGCYRWIHENNSIHNVSKALYYRFKMYQSLLKWSLNEHCTFEISNNIFNAHKSYLQHENKTVSEEILFLQSWKQFPGMIFYPFFWKKLKLLLIKK